MVTNYQPHDKNTDHEVNVLAEQREKSFLSLLLSGPDQPAVFRGTPRSKYWHLEKKMMQAKTALALKGPELSGS